MKLNIYGEIGFDVEAISVVRLLKALNAGEPLDVHINSYGGGVADGIAIYNAIEAEKANRKVSTYIDGVAASVASIIAMVGDTVYMPSNTLLMIHNPLNLAMGDAESMRKNAEVLDIHKETLLNVYEKKTGKSRDEISAMMDAETWMTAQQAKANGFIDVITDEVQVTEPQNSTIKKAFNKFPVNFFTAKNTQPKQPKKGQETMELKNHLVSCGVVSASASDADALAQVTKHVNEAKASQEKIGELQSAIENKESEVKALQSELEKAQAQIAEQAKATAAAKAQALVDAGKIKADAKDKFAELYLNAPEAVETVLASIVVDKQLPKPAPKPANNGTAPKAITAREAWAQSINK